MASVVTGAFGFIGRSIARRLLDQGEQVRTVTTHVDRPSPFGDAVPASPYNFDKPDELTASLRGASTLYNTYWVRFEYAGATFRQAVANTATLFDCARRAGIQKIVHISVTHASPTADLPYFKGKALQEKALIECGVPYAIVRPTLVFGTGDLLVNNIAWMIRTFPVFPIFGSGSYRVRPVYVQDLAAIAVSSARGVTLDAIGPEDFTFLELVRLIGSVIKPQVKLVHMPTSIGIALGRLIGLAVSDVVLTPNELQGLMNNWLTSDQPPNGPTRFSEWLRANKDSVGRTYASELGRHFSRVAPQIT